MCVMTHEGEINKSYCSGHAIPPVHHKMIVTSESLADEKAFSSNRPRSNCVKERLPWGQPYFFNASWYIFKSQQLAFRCQNLYTPLRPTSRREKLCGISIEMDSDRDECKLDLKGFKICHKTNLNRQECTLQEREGKIISISRSLSRIGRELSETQGEGGPGRKSLAV